MTTAPGRPRDRRIDGAVLAATADLLVEVGYADLTVAAVAERAGTTKPAIYRRWRSKAHLVHEAAFPSDGDALVVPDDRVARRRPAHDGRPTSSRPSPHPVARAAIPGLVAEFAADPGLHAALLERLQDGPLGAAYATVSPTRSPPARRAPTSTPTP